MSYRQRVNEETYKRGTETYAPWRLAPDAQSHMNRVMDLRDVLAVLSSQTRLILITVATELGMTLLYLGLATPEFAAESQVLVETRGQKILNIEDVIPGLGADTSVVESQVQILRSRPIVERAIRKIRSGGANAPNESGDTNQSTQGLAQDTASASNATAANASAAPGTGDAAGSNSDSEIPEALLDSITKRISVQRSGLSYIIDVTYKDKDAKSAALMANALADAYVEDQIDVKYRATRHATAWLEEHIADLSGKVRASEERAQEYMAKNNLVDLDDVQSGQREITDQMQRQSAARAQVAEAQARLHQLQDLAKTSDQSTAISNGSNSNVITEFRRQLVERKRKLAELVGRYGEQHPAVDATKADIESLSHQIDSEIDKLLKNASSNLALKTMQAGLIERDLQKLKNEYAERSRRSIGLAELKREAEANRQLYEQLLKRHKETQAQLSLQTADARVVAYADTPVSPSSPRVGLTLALGAIGSIGLGVLAALVRGGVNVVFRSAADVERLVGSKAVAELPTVSTSTHAPPPMIVEFGRDTANSTLSLPPRELEDAGYAQGIFTLRQWLRRGADRRAVRIVLVTSANQGEGKSTAALNLANYAAQEGLRTLLVDADLRARSLTVQLAPNASRSIVDVVDNHIDADKVPVQLRDDGFDFCPAGEADDVTGPMHIIELRPL